MKQVLFYVFALLALVSCNQRRGSGNIVTEQRQTGGFTGINVGGGFEVQLKTGGPTDVRIEADDNIIRDIETEVSGGVLKISTKNGHNFNNATFKAYITSPEINRVTASGAASVNVEGELKSKEKITLHASGAAHIKSNLDAPEVAVEVSGAGNIDLGGRTRDYTAEVSGSGDLKSADLKSENTDVHVSGAGKARVHASVKLKAEASGAGNISYTGGANVELKTSGAGNVKNDN
jgi:hypothetical protein